MKVKIVIDTKDGIVEEEINLVACPEFHKFKKESFKPLMELRGSILKTIYDYFIRIRGVKQESIDDDATIIKSIDFGDYYL